MIDIQQQKRIYSFKILAPTPEDVAKAMMVSLEIEFISAKVRYLFSVGKYKV